MALYRNISGVGQVGSLFMPTLATTQPVPDSSTPIAFHYFDPVASDAAYWAEQNSRYDYAMSKSASQLASEGIFMIPNDATLWQGDTATLTGRAWLPLQDIQKIENERGTAGALMLHMQQVQLAQDTAGYAGGGSASGGSTQVTDPIPEVQTATVSVIDTVPPTTPPPTAIPAPNADIPITTPSSPVAPVSTATMLPNIGGSKVLPLVTAGGLLLVAFKGDDLIPRRKRLVFLGGLAVLYYTLTKQTT